MANQDPPTNSIKHQISGIELLELIGQGAFADVYKARQNLLERDVAVKIMKLDSPSESSLSRFKAEAKLCSSLNHPAMAKVLSSGETLAGAPYIVMEYCPGKTLAYHLHTGDPLGAHAISPIIMQLIDVLAYAHEHGIIHRDLKPENVMLLPDKHGSYAVKLLDFGIARLLESSDAAMTRRTSFLGSPLYMSPEQCQGKSGDERSDIYSLGCILYELLFGTTPFGDTASSMEILYRKNQEDAKIDRSEKARSSLGKAMLDLLESSLARNPALRPQNMGEFRASFIRAMGGMQHLSTQDLRQISVKAEPKEKLSIWLILLVVIILGMVLKYGLTLHKPSKDSTREILEPKPEHAGSTNAQILLRQARTYIEQEDEPKARATLLMAKSACKSYTPVDTRILILLDLYRIESDKNYLDEAEKIAEKAGANEYLDAIYLARAEESASDQERIFCYEKIARRLEKTGVEIPTLALAYSRLGDLFESKKDYAKAESYFKKAEHCWIINGKETSFAMFSELAAIGCRYHDNPKMLREKIEDIKQRMLNSKTLDLDKKAEGVYACVQVAYNNLASNEGARDPKLLQELIAWCKEAIDLCKDEQRNSEVKTNVVSMFMQLAALSDDKAEFKNATSKLASINSFRSMCKVEELFTGVALNEEQKELMLRAAVSEWMLSKPYNGIQAARLLLLLSDLELTKEHKAQAKLYVQEAIEYCERNKLDMAPICVEARQKMRKIGT